MAEQFNIDAKLIIAGVEVKGDLNAGKLKFDIDTSAFKKLATDAADAASKAKRQISKLKVDVDRSALKKLATDATDAAIKAKRQISGLKVDNFKVKLDPPSLRRMQQQMRDAIQGVIGRINAPRVIKGAPGEIASAAQRGREVTGQKRGPSGRFGAAIGSIEPQPAPSSAPHRGRCAEPPKQAPCQRRPPR